MRILSKAFGKLKLMLPWVPPDTKLSKLDTLRLATSYISHLQRILEENESDIEELLQKADSIEARLKESQTSEKEYHVYEEKVVTDSEFIVGNS